MYSYNTFPILQTNLFYVPRNVENFEEIEYNKMFINSFDSLHPPGANILDHMILCIYDIWFIIFSEAVQYYQPIAPKMILYMISVLKHLKKTFPKHSNRIEFLFYRALNASNMIDNKGTAEIVLQEMKAFNLVVDPRNTVRISVPSFKIKGEINTGKCIDTNHDATRFTHTRIQIKASTNAVIEFTAHCENPYCTSVLTEEEIIAGFAMKLGSTECICLHCHGAFLPAMYIQTSEKNIEQGILYSPFTFHHQILEIIKFKGPEVFFTDEYNIVHHQLFWNCLFYFRLFGLPVFPIGLFHLAKTGIKEALESIESIYYIPPTENEEVEESEPAIHRQVTSNNINAFENPPLTPMKKFNPTDHLHRITTVNTNCKVESAGKGIPLMEGTLRVLSQILKDYRVRISSKKFSSKNSADLLLIIDSHQKSDSEEEKEDKSKSTTMVIKKP